MNIAVLSYDGILMCRPDTSRDHNGEDLHMDLKYGPLSFAPAMFCRIDRPAKCADLKFAPRHYSQAGFGLLIYPEDVIAQEGLSPALVFDHTSYLPSEMYEKQLLCGEGLFKLWKDSAQIYKSGETSTDCLDKALVKVTSRMLLRTGDLLVYELSEKMPLCDAEASISGTFNDKKILDFNIIIR